MLPVNGKRVLRIVMRSRCRMRVRDERGDEREAKDEDDSVHDGSSVFARRRSMGRATGAAIKRKGLHGSRWEGRGYEETARVRGNTQAIAIARDPVPSKEERVETGPGFFSWMVR